MLHAAHRQHWRTQSIPAKEVGRDTSMGDEHKIARTHGGEGWGLRPVEFVLTSNSAHMGWSSRTREFCASLIAQARTHGTQATNSKQRHAPLPRHKGRIERLRVLPAYGFEARTQHQLSSSWHKTLGAVHTARPERVGGGWLSRKVILLFSFHLRSNCLDLNGVVHHGTAWHGSRTASPRGLFHCRAHVGRTR